MVFKILFLISLIFAIFTDEIRADPIVTIANGEIRGSELQSLKNRTYFAFRGIPFGKPPVENLRFQPPLPFDNWSGVYNATHDRPECIQMNGPLMTGSEDCLFIYVYTPKLPSNDSQLLPVMTYIHGGAFSNGAPQFVYFNPDRFMDYDIIIVAVGYRLGPLGFLSTGDEVSMGNYGLLDQVLGLQWVQNNIAAFGGDKDKVTIMGESAGAASVSYHMVSEASAGLFRGVIASSGTTSCPWPYQKHPRFWAEQLAMAIDCPYDNSTILVDCLTEQSAEDLLVAFKDILGYSLLELPFVPCKEDSVNGRFLKEDPEVILAGGTFNRVPTIAGANKDDGDITYQLTQQYYTTIDDNFYNNILPHLLHNYTKYDVNLVNISYAVKEEYFDKIDINNQSQVIRTAIDLNSDTFFKSGLDFTIRMLAKYQVPAYMYSFDYAGTYSTYNFSGEPVVYNVFINYLTRVLEVNHGDNMWYLIAPPFLNFTSDDQFISDQMLSMWVNFVTELNPTPGGDYIWTPTSLQDSLDYLKIDTNSLTMEHGYLNERMEFWEKTVPNIVLGQG